MPQDMWHTVRMAIAALNPAPPTGKITFSYDLKQIEEGLPLAVLDEFAAYSGVTKKELLEVVIPLRTLKHRKQKREPLNLDESDRLARVSRIFELATRVYGNAPDGRDWLTTPKHRFGERTPLSILRTGAGELAVQEFLIQIDEGYFA